MKRIAVLDDYAGVVLSLPCWMRLTGRVTVDAFRDAPANEQQLVEWIRAYEIIVLIRERSRLTASTLERLPALELIALTGPSTGHVDVGAATSRGILVTETEGSKASAIELTMGLIFATVRRIPQEDRAARQGRWQTGLGIELAGKTLGIIGLGRIGARIAAFGQFLGMRVIAWGPTLTDERAARASVGRVTLDDLFRESDIVTVHLRLSERSMGIISGQYLSLMKPTAYFINTARGALVDESALLTVLQEGRIAGAALDVYQVEPLPPDHPFRSLDNLVLSPHMGYGTRETYQLFFGQAVDSIESFLDGQLPSRAVNPEVMNDK